MAIKEEQVDPEYETCDGEREEARQSTSYCNISSTKETGESKFLKSGFFLSFVSASRMIGKMNDLSSLFIQLLVC